MEYRNEVYNLENGIDCEINHPVHGWIVTTLQADDSNEEHKTLFSEIHAAGTATAYVAPPVEPVASTTVNVITMRQARLALLQAGLLTTIQNAITTSTDEAMKIEWEYATEIKRSWPNLIALTTSLGMTTEDLDALFVLGKSL